MERILIIGAGQAGSSVAVNLRSNGFAGKIALFGNESHLPYERPPLSKSVLQGKAEINQGFFFPSNHYHDLRIELKLETQISLINAYQQKIECDKGNQYDYDFLVFAPAFDHRCNKI